MTRQMSGNGKKNGKTSGRRNATEHHKKAFLAAFSQTGIVHKACEIAGVGRTTVHAWRGKDAQFSAAYDEAYEDALDIMEAEAWRRAIRGVEKPTGWHQGKAGGMVTEYSDTLLIFMLKGGRPEKYRERHDATVRGGVDVVVSFGGVTLEELRALREQERAELDGRPVLEIGRGEIVEGGQVPLLEDHSTD